MENQARKFRVIEGGNSESNDDLIREERNDSLWEEAGTALDLVWEEAVPEGSAGKPIDSTLTKMVIEKFLDRWSAELEAKGFNSLEIYRCFQILKTKASWELDLSLPSKHPHFEHRLMEEYKTDAEFFELLINLIGEFLQRLDH